MANQIVRPSALQARHRAILALVALLLLFGLVAVAIISYRAALHASVEQSNNRLSLHVEGLVKSLEKYRLLTPLVAQRPDILAAYSKSRDDDDIATALDALTRNGGMSAAARIELSYLDGGHLSVSSGNDGVATLMRSAPLDRLDVKQALLGQLGRHLLINEEGRFYIFSSPVRIDHAIVGTVSVHVDLNTITQIWALSEHPILARSDGQVILSNMLDWLDAPLHKPEEEPVIAPRSTDLILRRSLFGPLLIEWTKGTDGVSIIDDYVAVSKFDPLLRWTFFVMEPLRGTAFVAVAACVTAALFAGLLLGALWVTFNRRLVQLQQRRRDAAVSLRLERRVRDRTRELHKTQEGLIHSAKLAAIGQMSTVLSHEFNQPLAAIRSYADNAQLLFESGRVEQGQDNLSRIGKLVDRLADLSKNLKTFARKPGVDICAVSVDGVVEEAVMLMQPQAKKNGVALSVVRFAEDVTVLAGHTRLQQVLINLIANGLDAIAEADEGNRVKGPNGAEVQILISLRDGYGRD